MKQAARRILFVSGFFPPLAPMGAVRSGKLAEHWIAAGHDVRTLAIACKPRDAAAERQSAAFVRYFDYDQPGAFLTALKARLMRSPLRQPRPSGAGKKGSTAGANSGSAVAIRKLGLLDGYRQLVQLPDRYKSWVKPAAELALSWSPDWVPDVIYSSGPPHSGHQIASRLSARWGAPWIAEFRDLWVGDPYFDRHPLARPFHEWVAHKTLANVTACVVVTRSAAEHLKAVTRVPIIVSYNGYDPEDFAAWENVEPYDRERLTIIHAGVIYLGRRDPTPLFQAIAGMGTEGRKVRCLFYDDTGGSIGALAERFGIRESVEIRPAVPRQQILKLERQVDILLECRWKDPAGDGVIPGKLFEYIGARRPVLSIGSLTGEAAEIVRSENLGLVSNDPEKIKAMLIAALDVKSRLGRLPDRAASSDYFRRSVQFQKIDELIGSVVQTRAGELPKVTVG